jgi:uncharacterized protein
MGRARGSVLPAMQPVVENSIHYPEKTIGNVMTRCDHCGSECPLPFTCQHCGGKFCAECRLPPNHNCTGIGSWNAKPRPAIGMNYSRGGGVKATSGVALESRRKPEKGTVEGHPYLKTMLVILVLVLLGLALLALGGH